MTIEFRPWPKIARLNRDMIITEKIDGTNAAVGIVRGVGQWPQDIDSPSKFVARDSDEGPYYYEVYAQSRKNIITPTKDNFGFARWVWENADALIETLGEGLHFGEWWGSGIQRGYGLKNGEKRFSLFNVQRYGDPTKIDISPLKDIGVDIVPVLFEGAFHSSLVNLTLAGLAANGSMAAPGFMDPEGIIVFHVAAQMPFKVTIKDDEKPKGSNE